MRDLRDPLPEEGAVRSEAASWYRDMFGLYRIVYVAHST